MDTVGLYVEERIKSPLNAHLVYKLPQGYFIAMHNKLYGTIR